MLFLSEYEKIFHGHNHKSIFLGTHMKCKKIQEKVFSHFFLDKKEKYIKKAYKEIGGILNLTQVQSKPKYIVINQIYPNQS